MDQKLNENDILHFVNKANKLKGLIQEGSYFSEEIIKKCENLEMLATTGTHLGPYLEEYVCKIKQLKLRCYSLDELSHNPRNLCNLERLNISGKFNFLCLTILFDFDFKNCILLIP